MLKRRLYFRADDGTSVTPRAAAPIVGAAGSGGAAIAAPTVAAVAAPAAEPAVTGVGGPADSTFAMSRENLNEVIKNTTPPIVDSAVSGTASGTSAASTGSNETTYEALTQNVTSTQPALDAAVSTPTSPVSTITGPEYSSTTTGATTVKPPILTGPANDALVWTGHPERGQWQYKDANKEPLTDDVLGSAVNYSFDDFSSWPQSRKEIFYQEMGKQKNTLDQFNWVYKQKDLGNSYTYSSDQRPFMDPSVALSKNLTGPSAAKAIAGFEQHAESQNMPEAKRWNAAWNAKNLEPKQVLQALKSNGKSGTDGDATIAEALAGRNADDDLEADTSRATGPLVEGHETVAAEAESKLDAAAEPVLKGIDELKGDLEHARMLKEVKSKIEVNHSGQALTDLENERDKLLAEPAHTRARDASRQHEIVGEITAENTTLTKQKEELAQVKKDAGLLPNAEQKKAIKAAEEKISKTNEAIGELKTKDEELDKTGHYHERYDAAVDGLAKFLTLQNDLTAAARNGDAPTLTRLLGREVKATDAGLQAQTNHLEAQHAIAAEQRKEVAAVRTEKEAKWTQTKNNLAKPNDVLTVGTALLATGSGVLSSLDTAKTAINALLGNDGKNSASFDTWRGTIITSSTKLDPGASLTRLTALQGAAKTSKSEGGKESKSPLERLQAMLDKTREERWVARNGENGDTRAKGFTSKNETYLANKNAEQELLQGRETTVQGYLKTEEKFA